MFHRRSTPYLKGGLGDVPPLLPVDGAARARDYLRAWPGAGHGNSSSTGKTTRIGGQLAVRTVGGSSTSETQDFSFQTSDHKQYFQQR